MSFKDLLSLNVSDKIEKKSGFNYLSWSFAWGEFCKVYPEATYKLIKNENGLPYFMDESGAMCFTCVTVGEITHEMWLPVMDGANKAMKKEEYEYKTKYGIKQVAPLSMFDVNKTVMRCLVKNLAMFGLGLYIYAGEDLPQEPEETKEENKKLKYLSDLYKKINDVLGARLKLCTDEKLKTGKKIEITNSINKHLSTVKVAECKDLVNLENFYKHQQNKLTDEENKN